MLHSVQARSSAIVLLLLLTLTATLAEASSTPEPRVSFRSRRQAARLAELSAASSVTTGSSVSTPRTPEQIFELSSSSSVISSPSSMRARMQTPEEAFAACMYGFAKEREDFILLSLEGYYRYMKRALEKRRRDILEAWKLTDEAQREAALSGAWRGFGQTWREANNQLKELRTKAWKKYHERMVNCDAHADDGEKGGLGLDSQW